MTGPRPVHSDHAPAAIGPYSQAMTFGDLVLTAGQIALDPDTGEMVGEGNAAQEAEQVLMNLSHVLAAAGSGLDRVLRAEVYLTNLDDFEAVNQVYAERFGDVRPARVTVQVSRLPKDARVEIAVVAARA